MRSPRRNGRASARPMRRTLCSWFEPLEHRLALSHDGSLIDNFDTPAEVLAQLEEELAAPGQPSMNPFDDFSYETLANGMPILNSLPGAPAAIYLDFDGDTASSTEAYDVDGSPTTFNLVEQLSIVEAWRQTAIYFGMFNVNVTTIFSASTPKAWTAIGNNVGRGHSYVNVFANSEAESWVDDADARSRISVIPHEVGHNFGARHTAKYDNLGAKTAEYHGEFDPLHGPLMGVDYSGIIHKWTTWHSATNVTTLQDDMAIIAGDLDNFGGDGYRPDDYAGTLDAATPLYSEGGVQSIVGVIERLTDVDVFSFTSDGGVYNVSVGRDGPSGVDLKVSIFDAAGQLLASDDGDPRSVPYTMVNDSQLVLDLAPGEFFIRVESHGNYGDQGQYVVRVDTLADGWLADDVGLTAVPGYSAYDAETGVYTVAGSGSDISGSADSFQFLYQQLDGDGSITARVDSLVNTNSAAKAGLMIRESLAPNARNALLSVRPSGTAYLQSRSTVGGTTTSTTGPANREWLRLTRTGNTLLAETSIDGQTWTQLSTRNIAMGSTVYIGLAVTSRNNQRLNTATFSDVSLTGAINLAPALDDLAAPAALTVSAITSTTVSLKWAAAAPLAADANGDGEVNVFDVSVVSAHWGESGPDGDLNLDGAVDIFDVALISANWEQTSATGYAIERLADGISFTTVAVVSADTQQFSDTGLSDFQRYEFRVRAVSAAGVSEASDHVAAQTRAGAVSKLNVISASTSQLVLDWTDAAGESSYRVERSPDGTNDWTTVASRNKNVPMYVNSGLAGGTEYFYRVVTVDALGESAVSNVVSGSTRLPTPTVSFTNKASDQMAIQWGAVAGATGYKVERSTNGTSWSTVAANQAATNYADPSVAPLGEYYYRVTALNATATSQTAVVFAAAPAAAALPAPWNTADLGAVGGTGAAGLSGGLFTIVAAGDESSSANDQFRFVYVQFTGDVSMTVRLASLENTADTARAGLMLRDSLTVNSRHVFVHLTPDQTSGVQYRGNVGSANAIVAGPAASAPEWLRLSRTGSTIKAEISPDGVAWTTVDTRTLAMSGADYIGLALRSSDNALLGKATFDNLTTTAFASAAAAPLTAESAPSAEPLASFHESPLELAPLSTGTSCFAAISSAGSINETLSVRQAIMADALSHRRRVDAVFNQFESAEPRTIQAHSAIGLAFDRSPATSSPKSAHRLPALDAALAV